MLTVAVKCVFLLKHDGAMLQDEPAECVGDDYADGKDGRKWLVYPSDFSLFKPRADVLLVGTSYATGGRPVTQQDAVIKVGHFRKTVRVVGNRVWQRRFLFRSRPSDPLSFESMPIVYERAYGGPKVKTNPAGLGNRDIHLPNIESPTKLIRSRRDRPPPASFGPVAPDWEPRRSKVGSYKGKWLKKRWPWFPEDFDWSYFNAAPADQQIEGYLRGDEELEFQNLHPQHSVYHSRLPGLRARAFLQIEMPEEQPEFREVKLNLDTLWINMDSEKLVLVWRGLSPVRSVKFREVTHIAALTEPLASPMRSKEEMREWMLQKIRQERGEGPPTPEQAAEAAAAKVSMEAFQNAMAALDQEKAELEKAAEALEKEAVEQLKQEKDRLIAEGIDPDQLEQAPKPQTAAEVKTDLANQIAQMAKVDPQAAAKLASIENDLVALAGIEQEFAALEAQEPADPTRESVQADILEGKAVKNADLSKQDFSNLDLSGADLSGANFSGANLSGTKLVGAILAGASFSEANLAGADFSQAILDNADFSKAKLEGAKFCRASVKGASFSELQLPGMDFSGCTGRHPDFSKSNLETANFSGARLPRADFCGANLKDANFFEAQLPSADLGGAAAAAINMEKADLTNLRAGEKSDFTGGKFREANAPKSIWESAVLDRADFSLASLEGALFETASVKETIFDRAVLVKASFEDALAQKSVMTNANLLRANFNRANLTETRLDGSNLYEASFWETTFGHTNIAGANLKRTSIA